jgi:dolichol-phosphate mannosyltransferase
MPLKNKIITIHPSWLPRRFFTFATVGLVGTGVHLFFLALLHQGLLINFLTSQAVATFIAMTNNYFLNNLITFRNQRHFGKQQLVGLLSFYLSCSVGAIVNLECAHLLYQYHVNWAIAGVLAGFSGAICNFIAVTLFTWKLYEFKLR